MILKGKTQQSVKTINLALQGGGSHGAFTWGVLDALLEDGRFNIEGVSGTSAGAMNAIALANGLAVGGNDGAREALSKLWLAVAESAVLSTSLTSDNDQVPRMSSSAKLLKKFATTYLSPEQMNPFNLNPLRDILERQIDFEKLRHASPVRLFIAATNANSGKLRLFDDKEISVDSILASACLPTIHRAIMIDDEPYWDGAYSANPAIFPLFYHCASDDILMILLSPLKFEATPYSAQEIRWRQSEIAFQSTFLREMRMYAHLRDYVKDSISLNCRFESKIKRTNFHIIAAGESMSAYSAESKLIPKESFLTHLRDMGSEHAKQWLNDHANTVGKYSSVDLGSLFY